MTLTLAGTALLMGLVGGPHCLAMCGAACGGLVRAGGPRKVPGMWSFQAGRLLGYSAAGAAAGLAMQSFAWLSSSTAALQPVWTLFHVVVLLWGLILFAQARQPAWVEMAGRTVWSRVRPVAQRRGGLVASGALWACMPGGLLALTAAWALWMDLAHRVAQWCGF